jgi:pyruvate-formate lyase
VYDGLAAIRKLVCEDKQVTWAQLHRALVDDFKGHDRLRQMLANAAPRFGNGLAEVDERANRVNAMHAELFWKHVDSRISRS